MRLCVLEFVAFMAVTAAAGAEAAEPAPSPMLAFVRPPYAVPVTAGTADEGQAVLSALSADERTRLSQDGFVVADAKAGQPKGMKVGFLIANAPRGEVWQLIRAASEWNKYIPRVEKSRRVGQRPNYELAQIELAVSLVSIDLQAEVLSWPECSRVTWALDPGYDNDLRLFEGYFNLFALDEHTTLVEYGTRVRSSPLLPAFVEGYLIDKALPDGLVAVKRYLDSGGTYRKN